MPDLCIYEVKFGSNQVNSASLQNNLGINTAPIALGGNDFIVATAQSEAGLKGNLERYYTSFSIVQVKADDKEAYSAVVWAQITAIVNGWNGPKDF